MKDANRIFDRKCLFALKMLVLIVFEPKTFEMYLHLSIFDITWSEEKSKRFFTENDRWDVQEEAFNLTSYFSKQ